MVFFAMALAPGGNVAASLRSWARLAGGGEPCLEQGLPAGIYLGYFRNRKAKNLDRLFRSLAPRLMASLPPSIHLDRLIREPAGWFLAARENLEPAVEAAFALAAEAGLEPLPSPPLRAGPGYFVGNHVTTAEAKSFSFRHLDALLVRVEVSEEPSGALVWTMAARVRRLVGAGGKRPAD